MSWATLIVALVALQRLIELAYAGYNARQLVERGAIEIGAGHYALIATLHTAWLIAIFAFAPDDQAPLWGLIALYLALQAARLWVILSLGPFWTTRIITLPEMPLVARGPYRFLRHPNYAVVIGEIAVLPLAFREPIVALTFSALNLALLAWRIRIEDAALVGRR